MTTSHSEFPTAGEVAQPGERAIAVADALDVLALQERDTREARWTARLSAALAWVLTGLWGHTSPGALLLGAAIVLTFVAVGIEAWGGHRIRKISAERSTLGLDRG